MFSKTRLKTWLTLLRLPNLFTVPGDPLAGYVLAVSLTGIFQWAEVLPCMVASLCFYAAGILSNDYFDIEEDKRYRPRRPLPSGLVLPQTVFLAAFILSLIGLIAAALSGPQASFTAFVLVALVWIYNVAAKRHSVWGPVLMGGCRGLSLMMGAAAAGYQEATVAPPAAAAIGLTAYIAIVSLIARDETRVTDLTKLRRLPAGILAVTLLLLVFLEWPAGIPVSAISMLGGFTGLAGLAAAVSAANRARALAAPLAPPVVSQAVAGLIRGLLLFQAALCAGLMPDGTGAAIVLLVLFPLTGWLGRWFYGS